jgi:hypothetical protein
MREARCTNLETPSNDVSISAIVRLMARSSLSSKARFRRVMVNLGPRG